MLKVIEDKRFNKVFQTERGGFIALLKHQTNLKCCKGATTQIEVWQTDDLDDENEGCSDLDTVEGYLNDDEFNAYYLGVTWDELKQVIEAMREIAKEVK